MFDDMPILAVFMLIPFLFKFFIMMALSVAIQALTRKKPSKPRNALPGAFESPTIDEGEAFGVVFGTPKMIDNSIIEWWGDTKIIPILDHYHVQSGAFNTKKKWYTTGHRYRVGISFIPAIGVVDGVKQIRIGETTCWPILKDDDTFASDGITDISLNLRDFFGLNGGDLIGAIQIMYGEATQEPSTYMQAGLGNDISANRGLTTIILKQIEIGKSPYPKQWGFILKRTQKLSGGEAQWYISKADIDGDLNPAHFLRECYTNTQWGLGYDTSLLPDAIWQVVADTLYNEDFGVSRFWRQSTESLEDLITDILETIDGTIYEDPKTGYIVLKLIRADYNESTLPIYDDSDVVNLIDFRRPSLGEIPNTFFLRYSDVINNTVASIPDHDIALRSLQGGDGIPVTFEYIAITDPTLATNVLARERHQLTAMGVSAKLECKRTMADLLPGDVFKLSWSSLGFTEMVMRVLPDARYGTLSDPSIKLLVMQDVFADASPIYTSAGSRVWNLPYGDPVAATSLLMETPFWTVCKRFTPSLSLLLSDATGFLMASGMQPSDDSIDFELLVRNHTDQEFNSEGARNWTPTALITDALPLNAADVEVTLDISVYGIATGSYAVIEDEIVKVTVEEDSSETEVVTLHRGCLDTVPAAHVASSRIWFVDTISYMDNDELQAGAQPGVRILTRNPRGRLPVYSAPIDNADIFDSRLDRPYPPGNFKINSVSYPASFQGQPTVTWSHRDRTIQNDYIVEHSESDIGPEDNVTYTLIIYDEDDNHLRTITGLTGTTYTYLEADERTDSGLGGADPLNTSLRFVLYSLRTEV